MTQPTAESAVQSAATDLTDAAELMIDIIRAIEAIEGRRTMKSSFTLKYDTPDGGTEQWTITIERAASSH